VLTCEISSRDNSVEISVFIVMFQSCQPASKIVCTSKIGNLSVQVGVPPGVRSDYGHFEVLGGGA